MVAQDFLTASVQNKELQDELYYHIWFEFLMNYDKIRIKDAYQEQKEKQKNAVDAETLRAAGYSEEDIAKAQM
jgi:hypothetical protein